MTAETIAAARGLIIDMVEHRGQGHPGTALSLAPLFDVLFSDILKIAPDDPDWFDRDRLVLSSGHAATVLYAYLHLAGFDLAVDDLSTYRRFGSRAPGHPERRRTPGVDVTTGALGQGFANAVGLAVAESILRREFGNDLVDHRTYVVVGDGDLQEGISHEAASLAGHWGLDHLICFYNSNDITLDGRASDSSSDDVGARFAAYGWRVSHIDDIENVADLRVAVLEAQLDDARPCLIIVRTIIASPAPTLAGRRETHGSPLGADEARRTKAAIGLEPDRTFHVHPSAAEHAAEWSTRGTADRARWIETVRSEDGLRLQSWIRREIDERAVRTAVGAVIPPGVCSPRDASRRVLSALAAEIDWIVFGSADLGAATGTSVPEVPIYRKQNPSRHLAFGIREHGMAGVMGGIAAHGGLLPIGGTYLAFSDYLRPALRLISIDQLAAVFVLTHDVFDGAEDGPTHHALEHVAALRTIPGLAIWRPADAAETLDAWIYALTCARPTAIVLSREPAHRLPLDQPPRKGLRIVRDDHAPAVVLVGTGADVHLALRVADHLSQAGIPSRVMSAPHLDPDAHDMSVPAGDPGVPVVFVETGFPAPPLGAHPVIPAHVPFESGDAEQLKSWAGMTDMAIGQRVIELMRGRDNVR